MLGKRYNSCLYVDGVGKSSTSRNEVIDKVQTLVMQDRCVTIPEYTDKVRISIGSVHSILNKDLQFWVYATYVKAGTNGGKTTLPKSLV